MKSMIAFLVVLACILAIGQAAGIGMGLGGLGLGHGYGRGLGYPGGALIAGPSGLIRTGGLYPGGYGHPYGRRVFY